MAWREYVDPTTNEWWSTDDAGNFKKGRLSENGLTAGYTPDEQAAAAKRTNDYLAGIGAATNSGTARAANATPGAFNQVGGYGQYNDYMSQLQQADQRQYLIDRLNRLEIPMSQAEQANLIAKITGYWPGLGGSAMSEPQAIDAIAKSRDDKFWNFYRANGWRTDTPEQKQTIIQNWIKSGDPRWKGKSAVQVAQDLGIGGTAGQGQKTFEREQWEKSEEGRRFAQDLATKQFGSAEQAKAFGQALATKQFGASEAARRFGEDMAVRQFAAQQQASAAQRREREAELTGLYYPDEQGYAEPQWNQAGRRYYDAPVGREPEPQRGNAPQPDIYMFPRGQEPMPAGPQPTGLIVDAPSQNPAYAAPTMPAPKPSVWALPQDFKWADYQRGLDDWAFRYNKEHGEWPSDNDWQRRIQGTFEEQGIDAPQGFREQLLNTMLENNKARGTMFPGTLEVDRTPAGQPRKNPGPGGVPWTMRAYDAWAQRQPGYAAPQATNNAFPQATDTAFPYPTEPAISSPSQSSGPDPDWRTVRALPEPQWSGPPPGEDGGVAYTGGSADFDERTGTYRSTGTQYPPSAVPLADKDRLEALDYIARSGIGGNLPSDQGEQRNYAMDWLNGRDIGATARGLGWQAAQTEPAMLARWNQPTGYTRGAPIETLEAKRLREAIAARQAADERAMAGVTGIINGQDTLEKQRMQQQGQQFLAQLLGSLSGPRGWVNYQTAMPKSSYGEVKAGPSYEGAFADFWNSGGRTGMPAQASDSAGNAIPAEVLQPGKLKPQDLNAFEASPTKLAMQEGLWSAQGLDPNDMWARARAVQPTGKAAATSWWR